VSQIAGLPRSLPVWNKHSPNAGLVLSRPHPIDARGRRGRPYHRRYPPENPPRKGYRPAIGLSLGAFCAARLGRAAQNRAIRLYLLPGPARQKDTASIPCAAACPRHLFHRSRLPPRP
jgi:hypothetical protein